MAHLDYDGPINRTYDQGRAMAEPTRQMWRDALGSWLPPRRPLHGLDLGSGTGRFTPLLARWFGPTLGVEPSDGMRARAVHELAEDQAATVRYLAGSATDIPAADAAFDYALMFLVWHHVPVADKPAAVAEIARVLAPGAVLVVRAQFSDHMPDLWWLRHFPGGAEADASMYRTLSDEVATFTGAGLFTPLGGPLQTVVGSSGETKAQELARIELRPYSTFRYLTEAQLTEGFAALRADVARDPHSIVPATPATVLVLRRSTA